MAAQSPQELAADAKARGNSLFAKQTREGYEQALAAYIEAIKHDPGNHILHANCSACHMELAKDNWEPLKKVEAYARALEAARQCTALGPSWVKGFVRQADSEFELKQALGKWEERKRSDAKWRNERKQRQGANATLEDDEEEREKQIDPELCATAESASLASCEASCRAGLRLESGHSQLRSRLQALRDAGHATDSGMDKEMRDQTAAASHKEKGNAAFSAKRFSEAVDHYMRALAQDPFDHVFYSNRSACYAEEQEFDKALRDADRCVELNPQFAKGYNRRALALYHLGRYPESEVAAQDGLVIDPDNAGLQTMLKSAQVETAEPIEVQEHMHKLRQEKRQEQKMQQLLRGLGGGVQVLNPNSFGGLGGGLGAAGGLDGLFGQGGGKANMTEYQMRQMARAMAQVPGAAGPEPAPPSKVEPTSPSESSGPKSFSPG